MKYIQKHKGVTFLPYLLLILLTLFFCYLFCTKYGIFGSKVDWISQHSVFPDYFRRQFYETGKLFPEFAANLGGGQNIYNFAYYGLFNPLFLPSYALPFVKMSDYVMGMSFCCLLSSALLLYHWLRTRDFSVKISFFTALVFLLTGPVIHQSFSQIMFINYMPFLILGFLSVDHYFRDIFEEASFLKMHRMLPFSKQFPLIVTLFLMIMTSFYFSIGGMLVLVLYGIYRYGQALEYSHQKVTFRNFLIDGMHFLTSFIIAICLSGILLIPTAYALFGRSTADSTSSAKGTYTVLNLLLPRLHLSGFLYSPYGLGFGTFLVTVLFASLAYRKWSERFLSWSVLLVLTIPFFLYLLNGGLYLRYKAFIPFLPLLCYMIANYLKSLDESFGFTKFGIIPYLLTICCIVLLRHENKLLEKNWKFILLDAVITLVVYLLLWISKASSRSFLLTFPIILFLAIFGSIYASQKGNVTTTDFYAKVTDSSIGQAISDILDTDTGYYRISQLGTSGENAADLNRIWDIRQNISSIYSSSYNTDYQKFRQKIFDIEQPYRNYLMQSASQNPVYQRFMGEKYIVSTKTLNGYTLYKDYGDFKVYQNPSASPIAYGTDKLLSEKDYKKLEFPYNQTALLSYGIVKEDNAAKDTGSNIVNQVAFNKNTGDQNILDPNTDDDSAASADIRDIKLYLSQKSNDTTGSNPHRWLSEIKNGYQIKVKKTHSVNLCFDSENNSGRQQSKSQNTASQEQVLFLKFHVKNLHPNHDLTIWVNGERNKLSARNHIYYNANTTFTYAVPITVEQNSVKVTFGKGHYQITDVESYIGTLPDTSLYQSEFKLNRTATKGNVISGTITMQNDGYFITTIPYDKSFDIQVDGEKITIEKVNTAFLGCKLSEGDHTIQITYHAPGLAAGKCISAIGLLLLISLPVFSGIRNIIIKKKASIRS